MKYALIFVLILCSGIINAQKINGRILGSDTEMPLSFANIGIEGEKFGVTADELGNFSIDFTNIDNDKILVVKYNGYQTFKQKISEFLSTKQYSILLNENVIELDELLITPKKLVDRTWGIKIKSKIMQVGFKSSENSDDFGLEIGILFRNKKRVKIQKINLNLTEYKLENPLVIKFNIYSVNNGLPGEPLLDYELQTSLSAEAIINNTFTFDVSDKNIWINNESFFVSFQTLEGNDNWIYLNGALMNTMYTRTYYSSWEKTNVAAPALNIDVKVEK